MKNVEMQQQELAQIRQQEANMAALAAIGSRKKRKIDWPFKGSSAEGAGSCSSQPEGSSGFGSRQLTCQRITRVNLPEQRKSDGHWRPLYES
ncbi:transcription initiation factor TFIID subunit 4-like isoform X2 [Festucalex cinctus]